MAGAARAGRRANPDSPANPAQAAAEPVARVVPAAGPAEAVAAMAATVPVGAGAVTAETAAQPLPTDRLLAVTDPIQDILTGTRRIAVVGASDKPDRAGNYVLAFLAARGFDVTGVNPALAGRILHGCPVVATLDDAGPLDMVDVFRAPDQVGPVAADAIRLGARTLWLQLGVTNPAAEAQARAAGLRVVADRCPMVEWRRLQLPT